MTESWGRLRIDVVDDEIVVTLPGTSYSVTYPAAERGLFDPLVERMEDTFKPSGKCAQPPTG
jgi:hypothetical protein